MQDISIGMPHAVFHADAVPLVFQRTDGLTQLLLVFVYHGFGHHVEARLHQLFLGFIAQYVQRGFVDAENLGAVDGMAQHAAIQGGEDVFHHLIFGDNFLLIGSLLGDVDGYAHSAHDAAVQVV